MKNKPLQTEEDINEVIEMYGDTVYRLAISYTCSKEDSEDIFQEVFMRIILKKSLFNDEEHRKAWIIRVTINCCKKLWNSSWKKKNDSFYENMNQNKIIEMPEESELYEAIQKLQINYKVVIHLFYYEDLSTKEIAKILNTLESTVRSRLLRARKQLKILLESSLN